MIPMPGREDGVREDECRYGRLFGPVPREDRDEQQDHGNQEKGDDGKTDRGGPYDPVRRAQDEAIRPRLRSHA